MRTRRLAWVFVVCLFLGSGVALAQVVTGTISGTVSDSTGAVVPGATVTVRNVETGISRTVTTDAAGRYRAPQLGLGNYEVSAESAGFQTAVRSGITITVGREAAVDFTLQVGAVAERITVTGEAPLIETTNATVGTLVDQATLRDLPLIGRSFADLVSLQPGVVSDLGFLSSSIYTSGGAASRRSIGGTKPQQSSYLLDGMEITTPSTGMPVNSATGQQLGVDAVREFSVMQNNYGAQFGKAAGGVVNAVTMSGTNEFHGSVFEFLRNSKLNARDYFLDRRIEKAPLRSNQFGATFGGPIKKDHTFFFLNYEGIRGSGGTSFLGTVLSDEYRAGRATSCPTGLTSCDEKQRIVATAVVPIPADLKPLLDLIPSRNGNYRNDSAVDFFNVQPYTNGENYGFARIDQQLSEKDSFFGRFTADRSNVTDITPMQTPKPYTAYQLGRYYVTAVSWTRIVSPTLLNTLRVGYTRRNDRMYQNYTEGGDQFPNPSPALDPRLSPILGVPMGKWNTPHCNVYTVGGQNACIGGITAGASHYVDNTFDFDESVILNKGGHSVTMGGDIRRYRMQGLTEPWRYGQAAWQNTADFRNNIPNSTTQLIGLHVPGSQFADMYRGYRQTYGAIYVQDDFRVFSNLTLNLGVRWERLTGPKEVNGKLARLTNVYTENDVTLLGNDKPLFEIQDGLKGFSPRVGFAWTPMASGKTVLRGGFGAFKEMPMEYAYRLVNEAPPYAIRYTLTKGNWKFPFPFANLSTLKLNRDPLQIQADLHLPYTMQWTLSLEQQLRPTLVVKLNYLGMNGINQYLGSDALQQPTVIMTADLGAKMGVPAANILVGRQYTPSAAEAAKIGLNLNLSPFRNSLRYIATMSTQHFHSVQVVVEKRMGNGLRLNGSYTWSKNMDFGGSTGVEGADSISGASQSIANRYDLKGQKGLASVDVRHNAVISYTYELPFGPGRSLGSQWPAVLNWTLGGWTVNGTNTFRSGTPTEISMSPQQDRCRAQQCNERPDLKPGGDTSATLPNATPDRYWDPSQFVVQPVGYFGNVGRNTLRRPGINNMSFSLTKDNRFSEGKNLEFRAEFFNIANHPNFGGPNGSVFTNAAGTIGANFGRITTTSTKMRQIQFGLKLTF